MVLRITEINSFNRFLELRQVWNSVLDRCRDKHVFLTWEYLSTYWKHFGNNKKLRILCIENENKIIGIAPFRQSRYNFAGLPSYNVIEPLASKRANYTGLMLAEREADCLKLFLSYLVENDDWDFIYLNDLHGTSIIPEILPKVCETVPLKFESMEGAVCPYLPLPNSIDIFMQGLGRNLRYNLRRYANRLEKDYQRVEFKKYDELGSVEESMKIFFELHQKRWKSKGEPGFYYSQKNRDSALDVTKVFANNEWLALYFLTANTEPIAGMLCVEYDNKMYFALSGFDPEYSQYSVGNLLIAKIIEKCIKRKIKEFDFMKGDESYKFDYGGKCRRNFDIKFVNNKLTSKIFHFGTRTIKRMKMGKIFAKFS
jgi:CelD/BcsL family acetyltransferase involved in cellulose biosynthesis